MKSRSGNWDAIFQFFVPKRLQARQTLSLTSIRSRSENVYHTYSKTDVSHISKAETHIQLTSDIAFEISPLLRAPLCFKSLLNSPLAIMNRFLALHCFLPEFWLCKDLRWLVFGEQSDEFSKTTTLVGCFQHEEVENIGKASGVRISLKFLCFSLSDNLGSWKTNTLRPSSGMLFIWVFWSNHDTWDMIYRFD